MCSSSLAALVNLARPTSCEAFGAWTDKTRLSAEAYCAVASTEFRNNMYIQGPKGLDGHNILIMLTSLGSSTPQAATIRKTTPTLNPLPFLGIILGLLMFRPLGGGLLIKGLHSAKKGAEEEEDLGLYRIVGYVLVLHWGNGKMEATICYFLDLRKPLCEAVSTSSFQLRRCLGGL